MLEDNMAPFGTPPPIPMITLVVGVKLPLPVLHSYGFSLVQDMFQVRPCNDVSILPMKLKLEIPLIVLPRKVRDCLSLGWFLVGAPPHLNPLVHFHHLLVVVHAENHGLAAILDPFGHQALSILGRIVAQIPLYRHEHFVPVEEADERAIAFKLMESDVDVWVEKAVNFVSIGSDIDAKFRWEVVSVQGPDEHERCE
nr:hypothetical protein Ccrd_006329 [Ipomoea trifida]